MIETKLKLLELGEKVSSSSFLAEEWERESHGEITGLKEKHPHT